MNKESEDKLANAIISLHQAIEKQGAKMNLAIGELRLSYMKLDENVQGLRSDFNKYAQRNDDRADSHETRITRLEGKSSSPYVVSESAAVYKKRKKKK